MVNNSFKKPFKELYGEFQEKKSMTLKKIITCHLLPIIIIF